MKLFSLISPLQNWQSLNQLCQSDDAILLRQDAVYMCLRHDINWPSSKLYILDSDLTVRQLSAPPAFSVINAAQWVALCAAATQNLLWHS